MSGTAKTMKEVMNINRVYHLLSGHFHECIVRNTTENRTQGDRSPLGILPGLHMQEPLVNCIEFRRSFIKVLGTSAHHLHTHAHTVMHFALGTWPYFPLRAPMQ